MAAPVDIGERTGEIGRDSTRPAHLVAIAAVWALCAAVAKSTSFVAFPRIHPSRGSEPRQECCRCLLLDPTAPRAIYGMPGLRIGNGPDGAGRLRPVC